MSAVDAQAIWNQWPLTERVALLARWLEGQSLEVRHMLSLLTAQALSANERLASRLPDGRRQLASFAPLGVLELAQDSSAGTALGVAHMAWACVLGNSVIFQSDDSRAQKAVDSLREILIAADPALESLLQVSLSRGEQVVAKRSLSPGNLYVLVAPSADVPLLVEDATRVSQTSGVVLCVNHSLYHEVERRIPELRGVESIDEVQQPLQAGDFYVSACGSILERLHKLQRPSRGRVALYSGDWAEVETACDVAAANGAAFAVNTVDTPPLGLMEARSLYQRPSLTVVAYAKK